MEFVIKHFNELSTTELYEILKTRSEIFVVEQDCVYQDLDDKDQDAIHVFCWNDAGRVAGCLRVFWKDHDEAAGVAQIGRVVTLEHGKGIGGQMLHEGVRIAVDPRLFRIITNVSGGFFLNAYSHILQPKNKSL